MLNFRPDSPENPFRRRRIAELNTLIAAVHARKPTCRIIDIGGTRDFWFTWRNHVKLDGVEIDCVNMDETHASASGYDAITLKKGDARNLDWAGDGAYDIAFSNSVIEHVGTFRDMRRMAAEVRRVAVRYIVQTPYYWFPIEPHMRAPMVHWLPESVIYRLSMLTRLGFYERQRTVLGAMGVVQDARLLDVGQMRALFPDAVIEKERVLGLVKSITAVRR